MFAKVKTDLEAANTVFGENAKIKGKIVAKHNIQIDGNINGDIECDEVVIVGINGVVNSNIVAKEVIIAGSVYGTVKTTGKFVIKSTGKFYGDTNVNSLVIDEGGKFYGRNQMEQKKELATDYESANYQETDLKVTDNFKEKSNQYIVYNENGYSNSPL